MSHSLYILSGPSKGSIQLSELDSVVSMQAQKKFKSSRHMSTEEKEVFKEIRRQSHISAEQKRRGSIKVWTSNSVVSVHV